MNSEVNRPERGTHWREKERKQHEIFPGAFGSFSHSENITIAKWQLSEGAEIPDHSHSEEQWVCIISGLFKMSVNGDEYTLTDGDVLHIPSNARHSGVTMSEVKCIDVFNPPRDDYRK